VGLASAQLVSFLNGMAAADALNAVLALVFVYGYFACAQRHGWLGTLTLTVSMYAAAVFTDGTVVAGRVDFAPWRLSAPVPALRAGGGAVRLVVCPRRARRQWSHGTLGR
jgi:hypothetical protein